MRAPFFLGLGLLGIAALGDACSASTSSTPPDNDLPTFCADYAKAICQTTIATACNFDATTCTTSQTAACNTQYGAQVTSTRLYNQMNGKQCIDQLTSAYSSTTIDAMTLQSIAAICNKVVIGNQMTNGVCTSDNDCTGMLVCTAYGSSMRCGPVTMKSAGDPCADPGDTCDANSYCAPAAGGGAPVCTARPTLGGTCSASIPCDSTSTCSGTKCVARGALNAACTSDNDCMSAYCDLNPPAVCTTGLAFARESADCKGLLGTAAPGDGGAVIAQPEAGGSGGEGGVTAEGGD